MRPWGATACYPASFHHLYAEVTIRELPGFSSGFPGGTVVKNPPANPGDPRDTGLIPGSERFPWSRNSNPLQYSFLENSTDRGVRRATVHVGSKEQDTTEHTHTHTYTYTHTPSFNSLGPDLSSSKFQQIHSKCLGIQITNQSLFSK